MYVQHYHKIEGCVSFHSGGCEGRRVGDGREGDADLGLLYTMLSIFTFFFHFRRGFGRTLSSSFSHFFSLIFAEVLVVHRALNLRVFFSVFMEVH